jgi:hypothetical protein
MLPLGMKFLFGETLICRPCFTFGYNRVSCWDVCCSRDWLHRRLTAALVKGIVGARVKSITHVVARRRFAIRALVAALVRSTCNFAATTAFVILSKSSWCCETGIRQNPRSSIFAARKVAVAILILIGKISGLLCAILKIAGIKLSFFRELSSVCTSSGSSSELNKSWFSSCLVSASFASASFAAFAFSLFSRLSSGS